MPRPVAEVDYFVLPGSLIVELGGLIERGLKVLNLLGEPVQEVMTVAWISRP